MGIRAVKADAGAAARHQLITELEAKLDSRVVTYILSDRQGASAQIGEDAVRPLYDHIRALGRCPKTDLFLYSLGGSTDVPWRIVTMIRENADYFRVIVPYKSMSAATMIALGADEIMMGPKGELGPIDPQMHWQNSREGDTPVEERVAVEDIMSYLRWLRERVGLSDQEALAGPIAALAARIEPSILGSMYRAHSHIRIVARKLLTARSTGVTPLDEQKISTIIETLAEKTYQHGHAIGRREALELGLNVINAPDDVELLMWRLLESYEDLLESRNPMDPVAVIGDSETAELDLVMAAIESAASAHRFESHLKLMRQRKMPPQLNVNVQLGLNLPAGTSPEMIPAAIQPMIQEALNDLQQQVAGLVQEEVKRQAPETGAIQGKMQGAAWAVVEDWPASDTCAAGR